MHLPGHLDVCGVYIGCAPLLVRIRAQRFNYYDMQTVDQALQSVLKKNNLGSVFRSNLINWQIKLSKNSLTHGQLRTLLGLTVPTIPGRPCWAYLNNERTRPDQFCQEPCVDGWCHCFEHRQRLVNVSENPLSLVRRVRDPESEAQAEIIPHDDNRRWWCTVQ